jgi:hypothetical protein
MIRNGLRGAATGLETQANAEQQSLKHSELTFGSEWHRHCDPEPIPYPNSPVDQATFKIES